MFFYMCVECGAEYQTHAALPINRRCDAESDEGEPCKGCLDEVQPSPEPQTTKEEGGR